MDDLMTYPFLVSLFTPSGVAGIWHTAAGFHFPDPVFSEKTALGALTKVVTERPLAALQILAVITWIELVAKQVSCC